MVCGHGCNEASVPVPVCNLYGRLADLARSCGIFCFFSSEGFQRCLAETLRSVERL